MDEREIDTLLIELAVLDMDTARNSPAYAVELAERAHTAIGRLRSTGERGGDVERKPGQIYATWCDKCPYEGGCGNCPRAALSAAPPSDREADLDAALCNYINWTQDFGATDDEHPRVFAMLVKAYDKWHEATRPTPGAKESADG